MADRTELKRGRGRPPDDPSGAQTTETVRLAPAEKRHLLTRYGTVSGGVRRLVQRDMTGKANRTGKAPV